jgi:hypothetical protein
MNGSGCVEGFAATLALRSALDRAQLPENREWWRAGWLDPAAPVAGEVRAVGERLNAWGGTDAMMDAARAIVIDDPRRFYGLRTLLDGLWCGIGRWTPMRG